MSERAIFFEALDLDDPAERTAFLDRACAGDTVLRQRIEALLRSHASAGDFLATPAAQQLAAGADMPARDAGSTGNKTKPMQQDCTYRRVSWGRPAGPIRSADWDITRSWRSSVRAAWVSCCGPSTTSCTGSLPSRYRLPQLAASGPARQRFVREAQASAAVTHDNIIAIHAVEDAGPVPYLVMQFIDGQTLQAKIDRTGTLPVKEVLRIGLQIADGLAAAHATRSRPP